MSQLTERVLPREAGKPALGQLCEVSEASPLLPALPSAPCFPNLWGAGGGQGRHPGRRVVTMLPSQCWSSCSPSSRGCSASWTTSTSATKPWRRRWPWPPSCRACSLSQVRQQHSAQTSSRTLVTPQGPLARGSRGLVAQHSALCTLCGLANVLIHSALLRTTPPVLFVLLHPQPTTNSHTQGTCHT